jgi:hypothetical protein
LSQGQEGRTVATRYGGDRRRQGQAAAAVVGRGGVGGWRRVGVTGLGGP